MILGNKFYNFIIIFHIILITPSIFAHLQQECNTDIGKGICISHYECLNGTIVSNKCAGSNKLICCIPNQNKNELNLSKRDSIKWRVGVKNIIALQAYFKNEKEEVMKYVLSDTDGDLKIHVKNALYEISQLNSIKRVVNRGVKLFNARHVGILIGNEILEFDNRGYHKRIYDQKSEPGWNWDLLGNEFNGETDKTASDVERYIKNLAALYKDNPNSAGNLCFTKECDNYDFFCHNCHDFVRACLYAVGFIDPKVDNTFSLKNDKVFIVTLFTTIAESAIKSLMKFYGVDNPAYEEIIDNLADSIVEKYECSVMNGQKKIKKSLENAVYQYKCYGVPIVYAIFDDLFKHNNLKTSSLEMNDTVHIQNSSSDTVDYYYYESQCYDEIETSDMADDDSISDNNLNTNKDSENGKPNDKDSGANNLKQFSFFSIFMIFASILILQTHIIF